MNVANLYVKSNDFQIQSFGINGKDEQGYRNDLSNFK